MDVVFKLANMNPCRFLGMKSSLVWLLNLLDSSTRPLGISTASSEVRLNALEVKLEKLIEEKHEVATRWHFSKDSHFLVLLFFFAFTGFWWWSVHFHLKGCSISDDFNCCFFLDFSSIMGRPCPSFIASSKFDCCFCFRPFFLSSRGNPLMIFMSFESSSLIVWFVQIFRSLFLSISGEFDDYVILCSVLVPIIAAIYIAGKNNDCVRAALIFFSVQWDPRSVWQIHGSWELS